MLVHEFLERAASRDAGAVAVFDAAGVHTYAELAGDAGQMARLLADLGVRPGDRVVLAIENSARWTACYFGILSAGAIVVPLAPGARSTRLVQAIADCDARVCILDPPATESLRDARHGVAVVLLSPHAEIDLPNVRVLDLARAAAQQPAAWLPARVIDLDLAGIIYTSGSTGTPRGVMLSHLNIRANTESIVSYLGLTRADRMMVVLPFYYVYGLSLLHTHVFCGGSLVIDNRFTFPNVVLRAMQQHQVTGFAGVPSTFAILLHRSSIATMSFPNLRYVTQAGGAMAPVLVDQWTRLMPGVPLIVMYGATEASARLTYLDPEHLPRRRGSIGRPIPNVQVRVVMDDGRLADPGEVGELVARGSNISSGYWNAPDETRTAFGPLGYRTGDLGYMDEEGFLYVVGRRGDFLKIGAHRVGAKEIEDVLQEHPAVHEAAVVPAPDDLLGEVAVAFVSTRDACALCESDLLAFCRERLPLYKVPARVVFQQELPKSGAGKIDRQALRLATSETARIS
jgi:acyl-CoA synthetase (AMP-forming)/AMP-acid ligase II